MIKVKKGEGILPLLFFLNSLKADISKFNLNFLSERYYVNGSFKNTLSKPFYKDYENSLNLFLDGFIYYKEFLNYNFRSYFVWQGFNKNLYKREEKNFLEAPFLFNLNLLNKSKFPLKFFVKRESFKKINKITFEKKTLIFTFSQSLVFKNFPNLNFSYSWGKENDLNKKSYSFNTNYLIKNHSFFLNYRKEFKTLYHNVENLNFLYNYKRNNSKLTFNSRYFLLNSYSYINSYLRFDLLKKDYSLDFYYSLNKSNFGTNNILNTSFKKYFTDRISSNTSLNLQLNFPYKNRNFNENFSHIFYFRFLKFPKTLAVSPLFSIFFSQNSLGNGWGYLLKEGNLYEQKNFLIFENLRVFFDLYHKGISDNWLLENEKRYGYNTGLSLNYNSKGYLISFNFYFTKDVSYLNKNLNYWIKYHTRVELNTKEIPFTFSYMNEFIKTEYSFLRKEYIRILFRFPLKLFGIFNIEERFYFREKFENNLKMIFERNYGDMILNLSFSYIYLIYPARENNAIFYFLFKRNIKLK